MKRFFAFLTIITFILSCNDKKEEEDEYKYLPYIIAGQIDGIGIRYVDILPDDELVIKNFRDTTRFLDLDNDGIDDFEIRHYNPPPSLHQSIEGLEITPLGMNSVCISEIYSSFYEGPRYWVDPLKYNDTISANSNWSDSRALLYNQWRSYVTGETDIIGYWCGTDSLFIGVQIVKKKDQLFGWIDMKGNVLRRYAVTVPYLE